MDRGLTVNQVICRSNRHASICPRGSSGIGARLLSGILCRSESCRGLFVDVAQLGEQRTRNAQVAGSFPAVGFMEAFFFDDVRKAPFGWDLARDVPQAKELLLKNKYAVWSLDHDIGMQMACPECLKELPPDIVLTESSMRSILEKGCDHMEHGTHLVKWMLENEDKIQWPTACVIHSANPYGSKRMAEMLRHKCRVIVKFYDLGWLSSILPV